MVRRQSRSCITVLHPSARLGVAQSFDPYGQLSARVGKRHVRRSIRSDTQAIAGDWVKVGKYLTAGARRAIENS